MTDHFTLEQIEAFRRKSLDANALLELTEHLAVCARCRDRALPDTILTDRISHLRRDFERHLTEDELLQLAGAKPMQDPAYVEAHLEICQSCWRDLEDLQAF